MVKHGKMLGVSEKTTRNAVKDLGAISYVRRHCQLLSEASKVTRVTKGKKLLNWMKSNSSTVQIFSTRSSGLWIKPETARMTDTWPTMLRMCHQSTAASIQPQL